jgi:hypothetical protein
MHWRELPERSERLHAQRVGFGRGRSRGSGYLAYSDRVGPGVLVLDAEEVERADVLREAGFTALVVDRDTQDPAALGAAAEFLVANWHPRLGLVASSPAAVAAADSLFQGRHQIDVVVVHGSLPSAPLAPGTGLVVHFPEETYTPDVQRRLEEAVAKGAEVEVYVYEGSPEDPALIERRTVDALGYHLS